MDKICRLMHEMNCSTVFFKAEGRLEQVFACLEETEGFMPTHFGIEDQSKFTYERQAAVEFISNNLESMIWGKSKLLRYELHLDIGEGFNSKFKLEVFKFFKPDTVPLFFALGERLVQICHPLWFSSYYYIKKATIDSSCLSEQEQVQYNKQEQLESWMSRGYHGYSWFSGFLGLGMVSYMQNEIAQQFGMDYLKAAPAIVQELPNGLVRIALSEKPWEENWLDLVDKWVKVMTYLAQTGFVAAPHMEDNGYNDVEFMMNQKNLAFKIAMREKYLAEGKPVPSCYEQDKVFDVRDIEKIFDAPYLIEIPGMEESERYVLEHIKKEGWV